MQGFEVAQGTAKEAAVPGTAVPGTEVAQGTVQEGILGTAPAAVLGIV